MLIALLFWPVSAAYSQTPAPSQAPVSPAVPGSAAKAAPSTLFHSDLLDLSFAYPASLVAQTLPSLDKQHAEIAAREPANATPESRKTDQCSDKSLLAVRKDDPSHLPAAVTSQGDTRGTVADPPHAVSAKIAVSRIGVDCMPESYKAQLDNVATAMSAGLAQDHDLRPIDQPIWYEIGQTRIHFAASESASPVNEAATGSDKKPEPRWVGSAAFVWNGNLVSIVIESNDISLFNEMLHSKIGLGKAAPAPLFPADIGKGKPIQPKPDSPPDEH
ncbi:MAG TPA: hypothetical protein VGG62_02625 [Terracidiphilus sp.]